MAKVADGMMCEHYWTHDKIEMLREDLARIPQVNIGTGRVTGDALAVMEVLEISEDDQSFLGWYYISITGDVWNPELPLVERRLKPEWAEKRTQRRGKPPAGQESKWEEIYGEFSSSQVEILAPKFDLQSDGKVPEPVCRKVDTWLRRAMKSSPRAVLALSYPNEAEIKMQNRYKQRSMKLR